MSEQTTEQVLADTITKALTDATLAAAETANAKKIEALEKVLESLKEDNETLSDQVSQSKHSLEVLQKTTNSMDAKYNIASNSGDIDNAKINKIKANIFKESYSNIVGNSKRVNVIDAVKDTFSNFNSNDIDLVTQAVSTGIISNKKYEMPTVNIPTIRVLQEQQSFLSGLVSRELKNEVEFTARGELVEEFIASTDKPTVIAEGGTGNASSFGSLTSYARTSEMIQTYTSVSNVAYWTNQSDEYFANIYDKMLRQIEIDRSKAIINGYAMQLVNNQSVPVYNPAPQGIEGIFSLANNPTNQTSVFSRGIAKIKMGSASGTKIKIDYNDLDNLVSLYPDEGPADLIITESVIRTFMRDTQLTGDLSFSQYFEYNMQTGVLYYKSAKGLYRVIVVPTYTEQEKTTTNNNNLTGLSKRFPLLKEKGFENYVSLAPGATNIITTGFQSSGESSTETGKVVAIVGNLKEAYTLYPSTWIDFQRNDGYDVARSGRAGVIMSTAHAGVVSNFYKLAIGYASL